jgi:hypothetical protein
VVAWEWEIRDTEITKGLRKLLERMSMFTRLVVIIS